MSPEYTVRAKFITFEGMEGSGKTTQVRALQAHYSKKGLKVFVTREPGGTVLGNELRALLLRSRKEPLDPVAELFLIEAARAQHVTRILKDALQTNDLVLCDRYTDASIAYQGGGRGIDRDFISCVNQHASHGIQPDLTVLLDMAPDLAVRRALRRIAKDTGIPEDRFEREERQFHERVREAYLETSRKEPGRFLVVNAAEPPEEMERKILARTDVLLGLAS